MGREGGYLNNLSICSSSAHRTETIFRLLLRNQGDCLKLASSVQYHRLRSLTAVQEVVGNGGILLLFFFSFLNARSHLYHFI